MSRKNKKENLENNDEVMAVWEEEGFFSYKIKEEMESMWEIPQIFHFFHLTKEVLNLPNLTMYEMERMLVIPRASRQLAKIMTRLLSCPTMKLKPKLPPMPYEFWSNILMHKLKHWFKLYNRKHKDVVKILETLGIEPEFWNVFPNSSIDDKDFEDLSFKQRVWLLKTICDTMMHTRKGIQEEMVKQTGESQIEMNLGFDRHGARYIYFPQFVETELRIYRHCINNKILSSVKPSKPKTTKESDKNSKVQNLLDGKVRKHRKRKSKWRNGISYKAKRSTKKKVGKEFYTCNCSTDSVINLLTSDNKNLNCINSHDKIKHNNINVLTLDKKRARSLSKTSEESTISNNTRYSNVKTTNGYDTSTSSNSTLINKILKENMFKGFSKAINEKHDITVINRILNRLESEVNNKSNNTHSMKEDTKDMKYNPEISNTLCDILKRKTNNDLNLSECKSSKPSLDNLSNNSKTDDEKLTEIIEIESAMLEGIKISTNFKDIKDSDSASKSDDEKLNENETSINETSNGLPNITNENNIYQKKKQQNNQDIEIKKETESINENISMVNQTRICTRSFGNKSSLEIQDKLFYNDNKIINSEMNSEKESDFRSKNEITSFKGMITDLSVSNFQLVVDSVEKLRDLISSFSPNKVDFCTDNNDALESDPLCEVTLVNNLTKLLNSIEKFEITIKDTTRRAKAKLHKEWNTFEEGSMEDQDSSGENGLNSNWWILGSQESHTLPNCDDGTLHTFPLSSNGTDDCNQPLEYENHEPSTSGTEKEFKETNGKAKSGEKEVRGFNEEEKGNTETKIEYSTKEEKQQTQRVLRARGVSSYTEQLFYDDDIYEDELDKWANIETMYAAPSTQNCTSTTLSSSKNRYNNDWSEKEDSDQDWILPSSRKRKNKRQSSNRRLKSLQHKLLNMKANKFQNELKQSRSNCTVRNYKDNHNKRIKECKAKELKSQTFNGPKKLSTSISNQIKYPQIQYDSVRTVSSKEAAIIGYVDSVHSELDIKDEDPTLDSTSSEYRNDCNMNDVNYIMQPTPASLGISQQNSFIQQNSLISNIMPPFQHSYYMQKVQDYVVYDQQPSFIPLQQPIIQQIPCIIASQQFVNHSTYSPYIINPMKPQSDILNTNLPGYKTENMNLIVPVESNQTINKVLQKKTSTLQSDFGTIKHNFTQERVQNSKLQSSKNLKLNTGTLKENPTSLIVLSDSDDEIEILAEKNMSTPNSSTNQQYETPTVSNNMTNISKITIPQEIMKRINQGGITITPIKQPTPTQTTGTQLVVVVNETGNYYALALPNGSKLILTPEQVAQIRASNGGKLIL